MYKAFEQTINYSDILKIVFKFRKVKLIAEHNERRKAGLESYSMGVNMFTDLVIFIKIRAFKVDNFLKKINKFFSKIKFSRQLIIKTWKNERINP